MNKRERQVAADERAEKQLDAELKAAKLQLDKLELELFVVRRREQSRLFYREFGLQIVKSIQMMPWQAWPLVVQTASQTVRKLDDSDEMDESYRAFMSINETLTSNQN